MSGRRLLLLYSALLVLAFSLLTGFASPVPVSAEENGSAGLAKWAVILSPGPQTGVPWGGYHVTIAGYSMANGGPGKGSFLKRQFYSLFQGNPWHLHGDLPALKDWKGTYTQTFKSQILDKLADRLAASGFDRIKGPGYADTPWHISLNGDYADSESIVEMFENEKTDWYLWRVPEPAPDSDCVKSGIDCPSWQPIR